MYLEKFVHSKTGKVLMSIILGIGLATFFRQACKGKRCKLVVSPPIDELEGSTYKINDKCYTFEKSNVSCSKEKQTIKIA
jgi:hypothetical protein